MQDKIKIAQDYLHKVESIKTEFEKYKSNTDVISIPNSSKTIPNMEIEFKHLVYRYDSNMPLNKHLQDVVFKHGYYPSFNKIIEYVDIINFFIKYLIEDIDSMRKENVAKF